MSNIIFSHAIQHHFNEAAIASIMVLGLAVLCLIKFSGRSSE